jgi:hemerythrin
MPLFTWIDSYSVNIKEFDDQHRKLVELINTLHDAMSVGKGSQALGPVLTELVKYTATHFSSEETLMLKYNYPGYLAHKMEHERLTARVLEVQTQFQDRQVTLTLGVMKFLQEWLVNHIQSTDKKYTVFLNKNGVF